MLIDIDEFKSVNDNYGHFMGYIVISKLGEVIKETIRVSDYPFRIGGDEFAVLLRNTSKDRAIKVAEKIVEQFAEEIFTTDNKLYQAKENGRNQISM